MTDDATPPSLFLYCFLPLCYQLPIYGHIVSMVVHADVLNLVLAIEKEIKHAMHTLVQLQILKLAAEQRGEYICYIPIKGRVVFIYVLWYTGCWVHLKVP